MAISAAAIMTMTANAGAELYVKTPAVPKESDNAAKEQFSISLPSDHAAGKETELKLGKGFFTFVNDPSGLSDIIYYPVLDGDYIVNIIGTAKTSSGYSNTAIPFGNEWAEKLNDMESSKNSPIAVVWVDNAGYYAVNDSKAVLLSEYEPKGSEKCMKEAEQTLPKLYAEFEGDVLRIGNDDTIGTSSSFKSGWLNENGKTYYIGKDGIALSGWYKIGGKLYYFSESMDKTGQMVTKNTVINGVRYKFASDGECKGKFTGKVRKNGKTYTYKNGILQSAGR